MRLEPLERPPNLLMRIAYWISRRRFGRVISPLSVIYARVPYLARLGNGLAIAAEKKTVLDPGLRLLIQAQTSAHNGCGFCLDMKHAEAVRHELGLEKFEALAEFETSPLFDERERVALRYAAEVTKHKRVDDALFEDLRKHFSEREIVEITFVNALENFHNSLAVPLGLESDGLCALAQRRAAA